MRQPVPYGSGGRDGSLGDSAVVVGASTGGPRALTEFLRTLGPIGMPIFIVQHLPASFVPGFTVQLARSTRRDCRLGEDGLEPQPDVAYVAPGDLHMRVDPGRSGPRIRLTREPPVHHCRPAVDPLFASAAHVYGTRLIAVVLTGMGQDGLAGAREIVRRGGQVLAQDRASSVVWGMPGAVSKEGLVAYTGSPRSLAEWIRARTRGRVVPCPS